MSHNISHITYRLGMFALSAAMLAGCADDDFNLPADKPLIDKDTQLVIELCVPQSMEASADGSATRAGGAESAPTADECKINDLYFIAYPENGGAPVVRSLIVPDKMPVNPDHTATYQISGVNSGNYRVYVAANVEKYLTDIDTEAKLKAKVMDFTSLPKPGNLPMVYEPSSFTTIPEKAVTNPSVLTASMKFACVKVRYNILFDHAAAAANLGDAGLKILSASVDNVAKSAWLVTNTTNHSDTRNGVALTGKYYDNYTETPGNATNSKADVVSVSGAAKDAPASYNGRWAWQGVVYLPERYVNEASKQSVLNISARETTAAGADGQVSNTYQIPLGGYDGDEKSTHLPRGTYYEVIGHVKSHGDAALETTVVVKDWQAVTLNADFVSTYLNVSKTRVSVKSLEDDQLTYTTDGSNVRFECQTKLVGQDAIVAVDNNSGNPATMTFRINPAVKISALQAQGVPQVGQAVCYLVAGNIRKRITVDYDIKPFFTIKPLDLKFQYNTEYDGVLNTKVYEYSTNLDGIHLTTFGKPGEVKIGNSTRSFSSTVGNSKITLSCTDPKQATGVIKVVVNTDPKTTTVHQFSAYPGAGNAYQSFRQDLTVTVLPPLGPYRIYFRAINDYQTLHEEGNYAMEFLNGSYNNWPNEDVNGTGGLSSANFHDYWTNEHDGVSYTSRDYHRIYIYTQYGETTTSAINQKVWEFTKPFNTNDVKEDDSHDDCSMRPDSRNPGWWYYDLPEKKNAIGWKNITNNSEKIRIPEPGKTLIIFGNGWNRNGGGFTLHRAAHHLDPGIPLFDFEDREGYVLYDPTTEPYYKIYDEKPVIEDVTFTVYTKYKIDEWYNEYGVAQGEYSANPKQYKIYCRNFIENVYDSSTGYYRCKFKLKAARGDYEKAIKIKMLVSGSAPVETGQYIYYCANGSNPYNPPCVYMWKDGSTNADWKDAPQMEYWKTIDGIKWYRYKVPSSMSNGNVIIKRKGDLNGDANQTVNSPSLNGKSWVNYGDNRTYWAEYNPNSTPSQNPKYEETILFGGRSFAGSGHVGTYANGVWKAGRP